MKKTFAFVAVFVLLFMLCSCAKKDVSDYTNNADVSDFKAGILFVGDPESPFTPEASHYAGLTAAMESCGMNISSQLLIEKNLGRNKDTVLAAIDRLVTKGANVIFGTDITFYTAMDLTASKNPSTAFAHCGGDWSDYGNFITYSGRMYQANYLSGVVAGLKSLETGKNTIGIVTNYSIEYGENASGINAFTLGALAANPDAQTYMTFLDTWSDDVNESMFAKSLVSSFNCGVITQICLSPRPVQAAGSAGAFICGYGTDMTDVSPDTHLTSAVWNWSVFYQKALKAAAECETAEQFADQLGGDPYYGGLKEGLVDITAPSEHCPAGTQDAIDKIKKLIVSGEWDVFSGVKLQITTENGKATINQYDDPLVTQLEEEVVPAGDMSIPDDFIRFMNYLLISVLDA